MDSSEWNRAVRTWRYQDLALFAKRAHRQLGRGFVLVEGEDLQPVYVTQMLGAPQPLIEAVYGYDPEHEALVVCDDAEDEDTVIISRVKIESRH